MTITNNIKNDIIILLFSISIFFSFNSVFNFDLRFIYILSTFFLFFEKDWLNKKHTKLYSFLTIIFLLLFSYSTIVFLFIFNDLSVEELLNNKQIINQIVKKFFQSLVITLTILILINYKDLLIKNLRKIFDLFVILFVLLMIVYNLNNHFILFDLLFKCDLGFFYYTNFLFSENSHFSILAASVIIFFLYNFEFYYNKKILILFYIFFLIFSLGNINLTFYASILTSLIIIFCTQIKISKLSKYLLFLLFLIVSIIFNFDGNMKNFFNLSSDTSCRIDETKLQNSNINFNNFEGTISTPKQKLKQFKRPFENKQINNLSVEVYVYSFYLVKKNIFEFPLGVGLGNYSNLRETFDSKHKVAGVHPYKRLIFEENYMPSIGQQILNFNKNTGSNNFSKLIVEFGFMGFVILILILILSFSERVDNSLKIVVIPLVFNQLFLRGTGYFNSGFLIFVVILILTFIKINKKNEKN